MPFLVAVPTRITRPLKGIPPYPKLRLITVLETESLFTQSSAKKHISHNTYRWKKSMNLLDEFKNRIRIRNNTFR